jgi:hypothetical protein
VFAHGQNKFTVAMMTITSIHLTPLDVYVQEMGQMLSGFRFAWSLLTTYFNTLLPAH